MKTAILAIVLLSFQSASAMSIAPYITCTFTEPFITAKLNPAKNTVREDSPEDLDGTLYKVGSYDNLDGTIVLTYSDKILRINTKKTGSDGMSETVYSYEGTLHHGDYPLIGGCELTAN